MIPFVPARYLYRGRKQPRRTVVVIHSMEIAETNTTAEKVAALFSGANSPRASFHFAVDRNSVVQSVAVGDTAWHAPGANNDGIGIEHAGYARQSRDQWLADGDMLNNSAGLAASIVHGLELFPGIRIPVRRLTVKELQDGVSSGFAGHRDVTDAFHRSTHQDPGNEFPWDVYLAKVAYVLDLVRADPNFQIPFR